jgi:hypothetical protein
MCKNNKKQLGAGGDDNDPHVENKTVSKEPVEQSAEKNTAEEVLDFIDSRKEIKVSSVAEAKKLNEMYDGLKELVQEKKKETKPPDP